MAGMARARAGRAGGATVVEALIEAHKSAKAIDARAGWRGSIARSL